MNMLLLLDFLLELWIKLKNGCVRKVNRAHSMWCIINLEIYLRWPVFLHFGVVIVGKIAGVSAVL